MNPLGVDGKNSRVLLYVEERETRYEGKNKVESFLKQLLFVFDLRLYKIKIKKFIGHVRQIYFFIYSIITRPN